MNEMLEAFLAALVFKLGNGEAELTVDDILAVEGMTLKMDDTENGFVIKVTEAE